MMSQGVTVEAQSGNEDSHLSLYKVGKFGLSLHYAARAMGSVTLRQKKEKN